VRNRGGYLVTITLVLSVLFGLSAIIIDGGYIKLTAIQAQNAADAGAHAAMVGLKQGSTLSASRALAQEVMRLHRIAGQPVEVDPIQDVLFGGWEFSERAFDPTSSTINAVQVRVRRTQGSPGGPVDLLMGIYSPRVEVASPLPAIAVFRTREIVMATDLPGAADASLGLLRYLSDHGLPDDRVQLTDGSGGLDTAIGLLDTSDDPYAVKVVVLVSDGLPACRPDPSCSEEEQMARAREMAALAESRSISIYPVSLNRDYSQAQHDVLATLTTGFGSFYETDDAAELSTILVEIGQQVPISLVQ
jgi:hypothetical protein